MTLSKMRRRALLSTVSHRALAEYFGWVKGRWHRQ
jgi:hypothetical protein